MHVRAQQVVALIICLSWPQTLAAQPLEYLTAAGEKAVPVVWLTWGLLLISLAVIAIIGVLLAAAIWHRPGLTWVQGEKNTLLSHTGGLNWLLIGVGISVLVLFFSVVWTVDVLARIEAPTRQPAFTIEITGKQWWWQVRYLPTDPSRQFLTANEIHLPAGVPVRLKLIGGDVIHSFWLPQLAGKMDAIPGQTNETWIEANAPGTYRGQCTEYCGLQHAHMGIVAVVQEPADFQNWWRQQLTAPAEVSGRARAGKQDFQMHCGNCHAVRGTEAAGALGPDLSHLMLRSTIAAATLPNDSPRLAHWIVDPQSLKPGALMPSPVLSENQLANIHAYLNSLD